MEQNDAIALEIIFKAELFHTLGNDLLAYKQIKELKVNNNCDEFFKDLLFPLRLFYMLQASQHKINYNNLDKERPIDLKIDKRQKYYNQNVGAYFNKAELGMINRALCEASLNYPEIDMSSFNSRHFERCEDLEDFIIYICYSEIISTIEKVNAVVNTVNAEDAFRKHIRDKRCENLFDKFFGKKFEKAANLNELKRNIGAKLKRFQGPDRFKYWKSRFDQLINVCKIV